MKLIGINFNKKETELLGWLSVCYDNADIKEHYEFLKKYPKVPLILPKHELLMLLSLTKHDNRFIDLKLKFENLEAENVE